MTNSITLFRNSPYFPMIFWGVFLTLPLFLDAFNLSQMTLFLTYGLFAMSLSLTWGSLGLLCLGQAIFFGIGAYVTSLVTLGKLHFIFSITDFLNTNFTIIIGFILAIICSMLVAKIITWLLFNGNRLDGAFLGLVTLALAVIFEKFFEHWQFIGGSNGMYGTPSIEWDKNMLSEIPYFYLILFVCITVYFFINTLLSSPKGLIVKAIRENEDRTNHLGIDSIKIKTQCFCLSAGIAGLAGGLFATQFGFVSPSLIGFGLSTEVLIWVAVGGRFSCSAAFLGAISVKLMETYLSDYSTQYWQLFLGVFFIIIVIFMPKGLFGYWLKK